MAPDLILVVAGLSAAWAVFSIVGGERERLLRKVEYSRRESQTASQTDAGPSAKRPAAAAPASKSSN